MVEEEDNDLETVYLHENNNAGHNSDKGEHIYIPFISMDRRMCLTH